MGAKTALLAFTDGDIRSTLVGSPSSDRAEAENLVRRIHPGYAIERIADGTLDCTYPPDDVTYALALPGTDLLIDHGPVLDRPSELPEHLRLLGEGAGSSCTGCTRSSTGSRSRSGRTGRWCAR
ncbi:hypothetical protein AB0H37_00335 [Actinomadura sp. NPDC023710]|uniref:DUF6928 family protein n=1 Tax=Actinomadura sp. NPDC023710 TaxID=3158219 RepID=UPI0033F8798B